MGLFARIAGLIADLNISNYNLLNVKAVTSNGVIFVTASSSTTALDWTQGSKQALLLNASTTLSYTAPTGVTDLTLWITQGSSGGPYTITWPTMKWVNGIIPLLSTAANATDIVVIKWNGTYYWAQLAPSFA